MEHKESLFFLMFWGTTAFCSFLFLIPAASFYLARFQLVLVVPGILLLAIIFSAASRALTVRFAGPLAVFLMVGTLFAAQNINFEHLASKPDHGRLFDLIEIMSEWDLRPDTRIYSPPNDHLLLTYYSGLPVQSIAPVRKSFLDHMDRDVIIIDTKSGGSGLPVNETLREARQMGVTLSEQEAEELWSPLNVVLLGQVLETKVATLWPPVARVITPLQQRLAEKQRSHKRAILEEDALNIPILRGYDLQSDEDWWTVFVYRYVDVEARWRQNLNYLDRIRQSTALILPWGWIVYDCGYDGPAVFPSEEVLGQTYEKASLLRLLHRND
jgi:hypothetical protein